MPEREEAYAGDVNKNRPADTQFLHFFISEASSLAEGDLIKKNRLSAVFSWGRIGESLLLRQKPRRLQQSAGLLPRAGFRFPRCKRKNTPCGVFFLLGQDRGIEPPSSAWEAEVLPLN